MYLVYHEVDKCSEQKARRRGQYNTANQLVSTASLGFNPLCCIKTRQLGSPVWVPIDIHLILDNTKACKIKHNIAYVTRKQRVVLLKKKHYYDQCTYFRQSFSCGSTGDTLPYRKKKERIVPLVPIIKCFYSQQPTGIKVALKCHKRQWV